MSQSATMHIQVTSVLFYHVVALIRLGCPFILQTLSFYHDIQFGDFHYNQLHLLLL